jgi:hypothetical protein
MCSLGKDITEAAEFCAIQHSARRRVYLTRLRVKPHVFQACTGIYVLGEHFAHETAGNPFGGGP